MDNEIKLLKNNDNRTDSDLEKIDEFYEFLQGNIPDCMQLRKRSIPKLTQRQAFSVIWYLQEHLSIFPDHIERCDICGNLYDSYAEGIYWESKRKFYCAACEYLVPYNYDRGKK